MTKKILDYFKLLDTCSDLNSTDTKKKSRTKQLMKILFLKNKIPTANSKTFYTPLGALKFVKKHGYPVVIKPNFGGFSRGSYFPITNKKELLKACFLTKAFWPKSIIETYLEGKNYRILTAYNKILAITERKAPQVTGDGTSTIEQLINKENKIRQNLKIPYLITTNTDTIKYLKKQNLKLQSIPQKDQTIKTFFRIALAPGGELHNLEQTQMTEKNKELCKKINNIFKADIFGTDIIMEKGMHIDYDKQKTIVLEVNSRPFLKMHNYPRNGKAIDIEKEISKIK
jgi:cyanophycin synthetase